MQPKENQQKYKGKGNKAMQQKWEQEIVAWGKKQMNKQLQQSTGKVLLPLGEMCG